MNNLSFYSDLLWELRYRFRQHQITALSAQLAFFLILSMFPFLIFLLSMFGRFSLNPELVIQIVTRLLPMDSAMIISDYLEGIVLFEESSYLPIAALITLYTASKGVEALIRAFNVAYRVESHKGFVMQKLSGVLYTFTFVVMIVILTVLPIMGEEFLSFVSRFLPLSVAFIEQFAFLRWFFIVGVMIFTILMMYWILPSKKLHLKNVWKGSLFAIVLWMIMSYGFSYFVSNFGRYSIIYGSLAAVVILMMWLYFTGIVLMIGAELNSILLDGFIHRNEDRDSKIIQRVIDKAESKQMRKKE